jgi:hypothetical protein
MCSWIGLKSDLKEHAIAAHQKSFFENSALRSSNLSGVLVILSCFGDIFTYYQQIHDGRFYAINLLIGTSSETSKYKCEF